MSDTQWYYNLKTHTVEPYDGGKSADRFGPYNSREEAQHAMETVKARNEAWDTDPRYNDADDREVNVDDENYNILDEIH